MARISPAGSPACWPFAHGLHFRLRRTIIHRLPLHGSPSYSRGAPTWRRTCRRPTVGSLLIGLEWLKPGDNSFGSAKGNKLVVQGADRLYLGVVQLDGQ